jgi:CopG family transcriptional regulator/antitoxin EndoAI
MTMARITKTVTLSLPPEMDKKISALMKKEGRTRSELLREALRRYMEEREWKEILRYGRMRAKEKGITEDQVEDIVDAYRK